MLVEGLTCAVVRSHLEVDEHLVEGTKNRTIAATNMNESSSRAHTIFTIYFMQKRKDTGGEIVAKTSVIHLVDLAGRLAVFSPKHSEAKTFAVLSIVKELTLLVLLERGWQKVPPLTSRLLPSEM